MGHSTHTLHTHTPHTHTHSVVFAGFSAESLRARILDGGVSVVVTADEGVRGGRGIPLKAVVDEAVDGVESVKRVFVATRTGSKVKMDPIRDVPLEEVAQCV